MSIPRFAASPRRPSLAGRLLVLALASGALAAAAPRPLRAEAERTLLGFVPRSLGSLGELMTPAGIDPNGTGKVVGVYYDQNGESHAFLFLPSGSLVTLGGPGVTQSSATAIDEDPSGNPNGTRIVGSAVINDQVHAALWDEGGNFQDLGSLEGALSTEASAVSEAGDIVGFAQFNAGTRAVRWTPDLQMQDLGLLPNAEGGRAAGTNGVEVVGTGEFADRRSRAFRWKDGVFTLIPTLGGASNSALAISKSGHVVGTSAINALSQHAFFLGDGGAPIDLGTLGGNESVANALNSRDMVVGFSAKNEEEYAAFLWMNGSMRELRTLLLTGTDLQLSEAPGIDDAGRIVAAGHQGDQPAVVQLLPVYSAPDGPAITSVTPNKVRRGQKLTLTIDGARLTPPSILDLGPDIAILGISASGPVISQMKVDVRVSPLGTPGPRDLVFSGGDFNGAVLRGAVTITNDKPLQSLIGFTLNKPAVTSGGSVRGTVTVTPAAPAGGVKITLKSSDRRLKLPAAVIVPKGKKTATFAFAAPRVRQETEFTLTASYKTLSIPAALTVRPR